MAKKLLSFALALAMLLSLAACTPGTSTPATTAPAATAAPVSGATSVPATDEPAVLTAAERVMAGDPVTVDLYPHNTINYSGVLEGPMGQWLLDNYNIILNSWAYSAERTTTILASGDLPDVIYLNSPEIVVNAIEAGFVAKIEDYASDMPHVFDSEELVAALNYVRQYRSAGRGEVYVLPLQVGHNEVSQTHVSRHRVFTYWDYFYDVYKDGAPVIDSPYDLIDVMKTMIEAYPTAADGTPTYGTALFYGGSATYEQSVRCYYYLTGMSCDYLKYMVEADYFTGAYSSMLADGSAYYEGSKWLNAIYQAGMLDPDSINYDKTTATNRANKGYYMVWFPMINSTDIDECKSLYCDFQKTYYGSYNAYGMSDIYAAIGAESDALDAALTFLDLTAYPDANIVLRDGPAGERWDIAEDGSLFLTEKFIRQSSTGEDWTWNDGTNYFYPGFQYILDLGEYTSYGDGQTYICDITKWKEYDELTRSERDEEWTALYGYDWFQQMLRDKGQFASSSPLDDLALFCGDASDEQLLIIDSCNAFIIEYTWKMIFAKDDAEFEAAWAEMRDTCLGLGAQDIIDWYIGELDKAVQIKADLEG